MSQQPLRILAQGGLGNQLFAFVAGWYFSAKWRRRLVLDYSILRSGSNRLRRPALLDFVLPTDWHHRRVGVQARQLHPIAARLVRFSIENSRGYLGYSSSDIGFDPYAEGIRSSTPLLMGYFQSYRYLAEAQAMGLSLSLPPKTPTPTLDNVVRRVRHERPIIVHVRRGDYSRHLNSIGVLSEDYYLAAIEEARARNDSREIWIFSEEGEDACPWVRKLDKRQLTKAYLNPRLRGDIEAFQVIRCAGTLITANSSYSWWAASLAEEPCHVIYPDPWFRSLKLIDIAWPTWRPVPSSWIPANKTGPC